jgi:hypothetical protein
MTVTDGGRQQALLLHYAGEDIHDIHDTLTLPEGEQSAYKKSIEALKEYFEPQKCVDQHVYEFRKEAQKKDEDVASFATRLLVLAEKCEFTNKDLEVKRQIVYGCVSNRLRRKALESNLDLDGLLKAARAMEQANQRMQDSTTEEVKSVREKKFNFRNKKQGEKGNKSLLPSARKCFCCGNEYPHDGVCPAKGKECQKCHKPNHFASVCRTKIRAKSDAKTHKTKGKKPWKKSLYTVHSDGDEDSEEYTYCITGSRQKSLMVEVSLNGIKTEMMIDTGCHRNIIDKKTYLRSFQDATLMPTKLRLFPYGSKTPLSVAGKFDASMNVGKKTIDTEIVVVEAEEAGNLISCEAAQELDLIAAVAQVHNQTAIENIMTDYGDRFEGIGKLKKFQVHLHINPSIKPVAQPHRRIPFSIRKKVEDKSQSWNGKTSLNL